MFKHCWCGFLWGLTKPCNLLYGVCWLLLITQVEYVYLVSYVKKWSYFSLHAYVFWNFWSWVQSYCKWWFTLDLWTSGKYCWQPNLLMLWLCTLLCFFPEDFYVFARLHTAIGKCIYVCRYLCLCCVHMQTCMYVLVCSMDRSKVKRILWRRDDGDYLLKPAVMIIHYKHWDSL